MDPNGGNCYPSTRTLAADTGLHRSTVERHLQKADGDGWIERRGRERDEKVRWRSYLYLPRTPTLAAQDGQDLGGREQPSEADLGGTVHETLAAQDGLTSTSTSSETDGDDLGGTGRPRSENGQEPGTAGWLVAEYLETLSERPSERHIGKQAGRAKQLAEEEGPERCILARRGIELLYPYSDGKRWDLFDLERHFVKAVEEARNQNRDEEADDANEFKERWESQVNGGSGD